MNKPFLLFGENSDAWAIGNCAWTWSQNLPIDVSKLFEDHTLMATTFEWFSIIPGGLCCFMMSNGSLFRTQQANLMADTKLQNLYGSSIQPVKFLSFSLQGGWFIRYNDGTVRLSMVGGFPESFHSLAGQFMQTRGAVASSPQISSIVAVYFGAEDSVLLVHENGNIGYNKISVELAETIGTQMDAGWILESKSALCPWDNKYFFLHWTRFYGAESTWTWKIQPNGNLSDLLVREIIEGQIPVSHTISQPVVPTAFEAAFTSQEMAVVSLHEYTCSVTDQLTFLEGELLNHVQRVTDEWYRGNNKKGESGLIARNLISVWTRRPGTFPIFLCDRCGGSSTGFWYLCSICDNGNYGVCETCYEVNPDFCMSSHQDYHILHFWDGGYLMDCTDRDYRTSIKAGVLEFIRHLTKLGPPSVSSSSSTNQIIPVRPISSVHPNLTASHQATNSLPDLSSLYLSPISSFNQPKSRPSSRTSAKETEYDKELSGALDSAILMESPNIHWDDIAGLEQAKEELHEAVVLPARFPELFTGKRKTRKGILLYGPPGTGKTHLARACATEVECTFFNISCSDVMSKWIGESERLVKTVFKKAREKKPSIIFIDEIDAMGGNRDTGSASDNWQAGMKTEFLSQMDGVGNNNEGILVLGATNLPWKLDPALRRRFQRRIHIGLPDEKARIRMFEINVGDEPSELQPQDFEALAKKTEGFSGSDISVIVQDALNMPAKRIFKAKYFRKVMQGAIEKLTPCTESDPGALPMTYVKVPRQQLLVPALTAMDFIHVLQKSKPSVGPDEMGHYAEWTEEFGTEGA